MSNLMYKYWSEGVKIAVAFRSDPKLPVTKKMGTSELQLSKNVLFNNVQLGSRFFSTPQLPYISLAWVPT